MLYSSALWVTKREHRCRVGVHDWVAWHLNTLLIHIYIPTNKSEFSQSRHTQRLSDVTTVINIMML